MELQNDASQPVFYLFDKTQNQEGKIPIFLDFRMLLIFDEF